MISIWICESDVSTLKAMEDNPMAVPYSSSMAENFNAQPVSSKINDISTEQEIQILKQMAQGSAHDSAAENSGPWGSSKEERPTSKGQSLDNYNWSGEGAKP
ncbi:hypothetical protein Acr_05g0013730 [Actinidia rufa]|uniref:Uncharacterized protein n=1 Tax=Actinidia rufa TaxID=165716 RepID=A0A7J0EMM1_9ERIC|nr:hypothetical protein Acr_05g0013730 [Actinidia rufa]